MPKTVLTILFPAARDDNFGSSLPKSLCYRQTDAPCRSGDDRNLIWNLEHLPSR